MKNITLAAKENIYMIHDCKVWTVRGEPTQLLWQFRRRRWAQVTHPAPIWFWSWSWSWFLIHTLILILTSALIRILFSILVISFRLACLEQNRVDFASIPVSPLYTCKVHTLNMSEWVKQGSHLNDNLRDCNFQDVVFEGLHYSFQTLASREGQKWIKWVMIVSHVFPSVHPPQIGSGAFGQNRFDATPPPDKKVVHPRTR